jgi:hypothetical protein
MCSFPSGSHPRATPLGNIATIGLHVVLSYLQTAFQLGPNPRSGFYSSPAWSEIGIIYITIYYYILLGSQINIAFGDGRVGGREIDYNGDKLKVSSLSESPLNEHTYGKCDVQKMSPYDGTFGAKQVKDLV